MATGKPPWSQQYPQEVSALFYIGTTKSHPPIPEHLSSEAKDFLVKCFQKEPNLRPSASELLLHPFIACDYHESHSVLRNSIRNSCNKMSTYGMNSRNFSDSVQGSTCTGLKDVCQMDSIRFSTVDHKAGSYQRADNYDDDMCQMDEDDFLVGSSVKYKSVLASDDMKSFNPISEPVDDWPCNFDETQYLEKSRPKNTTMKNLKPSLKEDNEFSFSSEPVGAEDDDEVTESKISSFLDAKALELKKLQSPLYEEFFSISNAAIAPTRVAISQSKVTSDVSNVTSKGRSPIHAWRRFSMAGSANVACPGSHSKFHSRLSGAHNRPLQEIQPSELNESKETLHDVGLESSSVSSSFSERQRKWKEELVEELEWKREMMRQAGTGGKITSPKDRSFNGD